jgi:hypothetical protein
VVLVTGERLGVGQPLRVEAVGILGEQALGEGVNLGRAPLGEELRPNLDLRISHRNEN